jgi:hypothetical protein
MLRTFINGPEKDWGDMPDGPAFAVLIAGALFFLGVCLAAFLSIVTLSIGG